MIEQAVILTDLHATGESGRRWDHRQVLLGLTMLQRAILTLSYGGIKRILVLGREAELSRSACLEDDDTLKRSGVTLQWAAAGGQNAALPLPQAPFLLLVSTAVFTSALARWINGLHADKNWLLTPAARQASSGRPNSGFCFSGLAVCQAEMFPGLLALPAGGWQAEALDSLFTPAAVEARIVPDHSWVLVNSEATARQARRLLRRSMGKPSDGFFSRHLNRHISWPISKLLIRLRVIPTQVTLANLALGLFSGWLIGRGGAGPTLAAGLLFQFVSVFDGCDGEIARLTFRFSAFGTKLDNLCDLVTLVVFFINLPIGLYAATADISYLALGVIMALAVAVFYLLLLVRIKLSGHQGNIADIARQVQDKDKTGQPLGWLDRLGARLGFAYRKEFISVYAMTCCLFNMAEMLLWTVVIFTPVGIVYEVYSIWQLRSKKRSS